VSEPLSEYQQWVSSHVDLFVEAGEDIRNVARQRLTDVLLPGSGDFYVFDNRLVLFLHYAGNGKWSYEEDVYSPREAQAAIGRWIKAGGVIPSA